MTPSVDKTALLRQLIPKSFHFDGYSEINCPNARDKPFFAINVISMGYGHYLTTRLLDRNTISVEFTSTCPEANITFNPCKLSIDEFAKKIQEATKNDRDCIILEIYPNYSSACNCDTKRCASANKNCIYLKENHPKIVYAAVSFVFSEMKEALAMYFEITNNGGKTTMKQHKNKFFGMNFEFGLAKDSNITSTLMGIAVRNETNRNWYVFDPVKLTRKNIANMKMGNFPVLYVPTTQFTVGKLYKIDNQFYYVKSINPNGTVTLISGADGVLREYIPEDSLIPGMKFYTEVVAFDASTMMNPNSGENVGSNILAAILMMQWSKGKDNAEFSLDNVTDDSFNGLGSFLPLLLASGNNGLSNIFGNAEGGPNIAMLMALGSNDNENSDLTQMLILSQLFNNGNNANNAFGNIFSVPTARTAPTASTVTTVTDGAKVKCEICSKVYDADVNFCPKCGGKTKPINQTCSKCGATLMDGAEFCHKCGTKVGEPTCSNCGSKLSDSANFCPICGTPVAGNSLSDDAFRSNVVSAADVINHLKSSATEESSDTSTQSEDGV